MAVRTRISWLMGLCGLMLAGCDQGLAVSSGDPDKLPITSAYFTEPPVMLIKAARAACQNPNEAFRQPHPDVAQCRLLMDPDTTAAVILNFDGNMHDLPQLVISLTTARAGKGHVVTGCAFLRVPHPDGSIGRVVQADRDINAKIRDLLTSIGGTPVREVPDAARDRCFSL